MPFLPPIHHDPDDPACGCYECLEVEAELAAEEAADGARDDAVFGW